MPEIVGRYRRIALAGFVFGLIAPLVGLYIGLVFNVTIGTVLTLPWIALSAVLGQDMLSLPLVLKLAALVLSGLIWGLLFAIAAALARGIKA
jgi:hypothetical protein